MRAHVLQHASFEGTGSIGAWLAGHDATVTTTRLFGGETLPPDTSGVDLIVAMGGPMSVNDEQTLPWLRAEKQFLREATADNVPVLGVCLGAQLIASALGAMVYPNREKEIGWFPVRRAGALRDGGFEFPRELMVFHWHGETFDLPPGATHLAESDGCRHQAFQVGPRVIGVQFHPEMTLSGARLLAEHCAIDLAPARYVQSVEALLSADAGRLASAHAVMDRILDYLARDVTGAAA